MPSQYRIQVLPTDTYTMVTCDTKPPYTCTGDAAPDEVCFCPGCTERRLGSDWTTCFSTVEKTASDAWRQVERHAQSHCRCRDDQHHYRSDRHATL